MAVPQVETAATAGGVTENGSQRGTGGDFFPSPTSTSGGGGGVGGGGTGSAGGCCCCLCSQASTLQCLICLKNGVRPAPTFCGAACFREHWNAHKCGADSPSPSSSPELRTPSTISQPPPPVTQPITNHPAGVPPLPEPKRPRPQISTHARSGSAAAAVWNSSCWPASAGSCYPHQWYDVKWGLPRAHSGIGAFPRTHPPEQVVGPTAGWGEYNPSRWTSPPYRYWGNY